MSKIKSLFVKLFGGITHSAYVTEVKDALDRAHDEALAAVKDALAKVEALEPQVETAVEAAVKQAIEAVEADVLGAL